MTCALLIFKKSKTMNRKLSVLCTCAFLLLMMHGHAQVEGQVTAIDQLRLGLLHMSEAQSQQRKVQEFQAFQEFWMNDDAHSSKPKDADTVALTVQEKVGFDDLIFMFQVQDMEPVYEIWTSQDKAEGDLVWATYNEGFPATSIDNYPIQVNEDVFISSIQLPTGLSRSITRYYLRRYSGEIRDSLSCKLRQLEWDLYQLQRDLEAAGQIPAEALPPGTKTPEMSYQEIQLAKGELRNQKQRILKQVYPTVREQFVLLEDTLKSLESLKNTNQNAAHVSGQSDKYELLFQRDERFSWGSAYHQIEELMHAQFIKAINYDYGELQLGCAQMDQASLSSWIATLDRFLPYYKPFLQVSSTSYGDDFIVLNATFRNVGETYDNTHSRSFYLKKVVQ